MGGASSFYGWAKQLPRDVEVAAIQMPGLESRIMESPITGAPLAFEMLKDTIYPKAGNPFAFVGHSLGAFTSFELARNLRKQHGIQPFYLFVSGIRAPQIPNARPQIHHLPETDLSGTTIFLRILNASASSTPYPMS